MLPGVCHVSSVYMSLSMSISDEIKDATIAIDETKISEIEATKRRFRNYCVQTNISQTDLNI